MLRNNRVYRVLRAAVTIIAAAWRYFWLDVRSRWRWSRPSEAAWNRAHQKTGRAIYGLAASLGGAYVKLGQILAGRGDFFPEAFVAPMASLHDRVPPRPFDELTAHVERELGKPIDSVFESIEEIALAAASLAQVHRAVLKRRDDGSGGEEVAVKIQYPEAKRLFPTDLGSLRRAVRVARWLNRTLDLRQLVDELAHFVVLELDFAREARSTQRVRENVAASALEGVFIPTIYETLSSEKLLVLEFIEGRSLATLGSDPDPAIDRPKVAARIASIYAAMIFEHGFFQGDPHPGNFLVRPDGTVAMLDFGLAKELPPGFADGVAQMIVAAVAGDGAGARRAAEAIGFVFASPDPEPLVATLRMLLGDYSNPERLKTILVASGIEKVPPEFALIVRAFMLLNGLSHRLVPGERVIMKTLAAALLSRVAASRAVESAV